MTHVITVYFQCNGGWTPFKCEPIVSGLPGLYSSVGHSPNCDSADADSGAYPAIRRLDSFRLFNAARNNQLMENRRHRISVGPGVSGQRKGQTTPQLSCSLCTERKVKCDKLKPCTHCVSSGVPCVPIHRLRLSRGRHVHHLPRTSPPAINGQVQTTAADDDLKDRIRRLEALVDSMSSRTTGVDTESQASRQQSVGEHETRATNITSTSSSRSSLAVSSGAEKSGHLMQRTDHFWADLVEEIHGLRGVIESGPGEADEDSVQASDPTQVDSADGGIRALGLLGSANPFTVGVASGWVAFSRDTVVAGRLCRVYLSQVDPIMKILHRPTLERWMLYGEQYLGYPDGHSSVEALSSAVCYSAVSSLTENQCQASFHTSKSIVVPDCRRACEEAIGRSGLLTTRDITVLQAFVLYLIARRCEDRTRAVWTLIATAVRIAKALSLHLDSDQRVGASETFFYQQMRKRLWHTICLIDLQASFLYGKSEPLVSPEEAASSTTLPGHINDSDFDPTTTRQVPNKEGLTDTTFASVTYHLQSVGRMVSLASQEQNMSDREVRQQHAQHFEKETLKLLHFCDPESSQYAWFTWHGTQCLVAGVRLATLRPPRRAHGDKSAPPPRIGSNTELLRLSLLVLEKAQLMHTDPRGEGFRWYIAIPWHPLAIAIAECCVCTDAILVRRSWPLIEASYQQHEAVIAKNSGGRLQGPLGRLMRRAREKLKLPLDGSPGPTGRSNFDIAKSISAAQVDLQMPPSTNTALRATLAEIPPTSSAVAFGTAQSSVTPLVPEQMWNNTSLMSEDQPIFHSVTPTAGPSPPQDMMDESWKTWEEFVSDISFDELANPDMFFYSNNTEAF
ncbi:C6 transcription factor [Xylariales sp. AK1849]|nr:C6 transcription factor [Xylariales sp. AK1849]